MYGKAEEFAKCKDEQSFKMKWLKNNQSGELYRFCIETEETVKGFPDVMEINKRSSVTSFLEFKFTKTGKIKFQPTQPAFYKSHPELRMYVLAYNAWSKQLHLFEASLIFHTGVYQMNEKAEVDLCKAERLMKS